MKIITILKLVALSTIFVVGLTYITVEPPKKMVKKEIILSDMPKTVELIGFENKEFSSQSIIKPYSVIFVGNHESIVLAKSLEDMINLPLGQFVTVSNISDAPWFIKRWQAHNKNIELEGKSANPWIYDRKGAVRHFLQVPTSDALKYFVYYVTKNGIVQKIYQGQVKSGTIDGAMSKEEIESNLTEVAALIRTLK